MNKKRSKNYDRVMSRVVSNSRTSLASKSHVLRHEVPSSVRVGAKPSVSHVSSSVFSELPTVLNDFVPEDSEKRVESSVKMSRVVKPRRTLKSLDTSKSPPRTVTKSRAMPMPRLLRAEESAPMLQDDEEWSDSHVRQCYSSRSHNRLKSLKDEIKAYHETEKLMRWRSHLYKKCGVVFDEDGNVAYDKAVQVEVAKEKDLEDLRRHEWLQVVGRQDLIGKLEEANSRRNYRICEQHFETAYIKFSKKKTLKYLTENAYPTLNLSRIDDCASTSASHYAQNTAIDNPTITSSGNCENISLDAKGIPVLADQTICDFQVVHTDFSHKTYGHESKSLQTCLRNLSANTPRKRKLSSKLQEAKETRSLDLDSITKDDFLKLCDKFLSKNMTRLIQWQIDLKMENSAFECKMEWTKLRNAYLHALIRRQRNDKKYPEWKYERELSFLLPFLGSKYQESSPKAISNATDESIINDSTTDEGSSANNMNDEKESYLQVDMEMSGNDSVQIKEEYDNAEVEEFKSESTSKSTSDEKEPYLQVDMEMSGNDPVQIKEEYDNAEVEEFKSESTSKSTSEVEDSESEELAVAMLNYLKKSKERDPIDLFFMSMANTVKQFPEIEQIRLKAKIFEVVNNAEMKFYCGEQQKGE